MDVSAHVPILGQDISFTNQHVGLFLCALIICRSSRRVESNAAGCCSEITCVLTPRVSQQYHLLKKGLTSRFGADRDGYTEAKSAFVRSVLEMAEMETASERDTAH